jgi:hypothetical protein
LHGCNQEPDRTQRAAKPQGERTTRPAEHAPKVGRIGGSCGPGCVPRCPVCAPNAPNVEDENGEPALRPLRELLQLRPVPL